MSVTAQDYADAFGRFGTAAKQSAVAMEDLRESFVLLAKMVRRWYGPTGLKLPDTMLTCRMRSYAIGRLILSQRSTRRLRMRLIEGGRL